MNFRIEYTIFFAVTLFTNTRQDDVDNGIPTSSPISTDEQLLLARRVNDLGLKMMNKMIEQGNGENIVISPTSIAGLLAMALLGSIGPTFDEIVQAVGFSSDVLMNTNHHRQFGALLQALNSNNDTRTSYANAIFVSERAHLRDIYRDFTERVYRGSVANTNFYDPGPAMDNINQWVSDQTNGKIPKFLKESLPIDTKVVLLSALYFSGAWEKPFAPEFTKMMPFYTQNGTEVEAELMLAYGMFKYISCPDINSHMVAIPYKDGNTVLYAIKPRRREQLSLPELLKQLDSEKLDKLINEATNKTTIIRFPKMNLSHRSDLKDVLQSLGVQSMFSPVANFGLMIDVSLEHNETVDDLLVTRSGDWAPATSEVVRERLSSIPNPGVHVDRIIHEVQMNINEYGTEASAATGGVLVRTTEFFLCDSPFYFFIRNERTKLVTFSAAIFDPTEIA